MGVVGQILEGTFLLIMMYLVIGNADKFATAMASIGSVYQGSVRVLQARG